VARVAVTRRFDLTDAQWALLEPLLPKPVTGRPPKWSKRQLIDGVRWRIRVGAPWRDVPDCYGHWCSVYGLYRRWQRDGTWARILTGLQGRGDALGLIGWDVSVDSTIARAHQHAAGARRQSSAQVEPPAGVGALEPDDHALGRSRGGLTTKLHLACEQGRKVLALVVTGGQRADSPQFAAVLGRIRVPRVGTGRPRTRPERVLADKAYSSRANRAHLRHRSISCVIPVKADQAAHRRNRGYVVGGHRRSTGPPTVGATPSSAASTCSNSTALWPPATTNLPCATKPPPPSASSTSGSAAWHSTYETRPR
jgi:transposase